VFERQLFGVPFQYPFTIGKHSLNIAMHGDRYELRVDGMSFSHLYNLTKSKQYGAPEKYDEEDYDMGAYGDDVADYSASKGKSGYGYEEEAYSKSPTKAVSKEDPFGWDNPRPSSQKFESYAKPKASAEDFEDTGYEGWNDVKRSVTEVVKTAPDPYKKSSMVKKASYDQDEAFSNPRRVKATTVAGKGNDFFEGGYNKPSASKQFDFDKAAQPREFDFDNFGAAKSKTARKGNDFDDGFGTTNSKPNAKQEDDPFSWGNSGSSSNQKQKAFSSGLDFDFNSGKDKPAQQTKKKVADELFESSGKTIATQEKFDPFADNEPSSNKPIHDLADIKFDTPTPPAPKPELFDKDPFIEKEVKKQPEVNKEDEKLAPDELLSK